MKKRFVILFLVSCLGLSGILSGCSGSADEKQNEYKELGISQMDSGDYVEAEESFQNALDESKGHVGAAEIDLCYYKALAQFKSGDIEKAISTYTGLIDYDNKNWKAYYLRGCAYAEEENSENAISDFDTALSLNGSDFELYENIFQNLASAGYTDEAKTFIERYLSDNPDDMQAIADLADAAMEAEDYEDAITYYLKIMDAGESDLLEACSRNLVIAYEKTQQYEEAYQAATDFVVAFPDDADMLKEVEFLGTRVEDNISDTDATESDDAE